MTFPRATYRVQLHQDFPIDQVRQILPFLEKLGISDLYISPPFEARPGSTHGYDVCDPSRVNPEIGGDEAFERLVEDLRARGMGLLVDIVPNHMAANCRNRWWTDVLENGVYSDFAEYFDVEWSSPAGGTGTGAEKILLPILGDPFGTVLEKKQLRLGISERGFQVHYWSIELPIDSRTYSLIVPDAPNSKEELWREYNSNAEFRKFVDQRIEEFNGIEGNPGSFDLLEDLMQRQHYRLAWWRTARERINYRRFFDVSDLVGLRQEVPKVFEATHRRICEWVRTGKATGLRVDHVDGLFEPRAYLEKLSTLCDVHKPYILVEKILIDDETLPDDWPIDGTTGYDFLGMTNNLFIDGSNLPALQEGYATFTGLKWTFEDAAYQQKRWIIEHLFQGEMFVLGLHLSLLADIDRVGRDLSPQELRKALVEITACLPVYRTYIDKPEVSDRDRRVLVQAIEEARRRCPDISDAVYQFLSRVFLFETPRNITDDQRRDWLWLIMRWQQLTGPIAAKGVEDTTLYLYNRLIPMNDVGGQHREISVDRYHQFQVERSQRWPHTMNALSTHDTKRSGDVRARLNVLSEMPNQWNRALTRWSRWNRDKKLAMNAPDGNEETLLYQTMLGAWPLDEADVPQFVERLKAYVVKAAREAKVYSSWVEPNEEHEKNIHAFIDSIVDPARSSRFLTAFHELRDDLSWYGMLNSLSQTLLKVVTPGVPDFYQGTELWDFSLVDPDNRRPLDLARRMAFLEHWDNWQHRELLENWRDGRVKTFAVRRALAQKVEGDYLPILCDDPRVFAFARRSGERWWLVVVPRLVTKIAGAGKLPVGRRVWKDVGLQLPADAPTRWQNAHTGQTVTSALVGDILKEFPVALLYH